MNRFPDILKDVLDIDEDSDDEIDIAVSAMLEEEEMAHHTTVTHHRGSVPGHRTINRNQHEGHERLWRDYFSEDLVYPPTLFHRRFRMSHPLFCCIVNGVEARNDYFRQKRDGVGVLGLSSLQKVTATIRMLAYDQPADSVDEYIRIGESTVFECVRQFVVTIVDVYGEQYLRAPNCNDITRLLAINEQVGFPRMLGNIDCSINDINVLDRSPIFDTVAHGHAPAINYEINGHEYTMGYYLADGIYPVWATFVKTISCPQGWKHKHFATMQEARRKDVERAFGVLQAHFAIVRGPARYWDVDTLSNIMKSCIIMDNVIIEDEGANVINIDFDGGEVNPLEPISHENSVEVTQMFENLGRVRSGEVHNQLKMDLIEHLWEHHGDQ